jgi:hypothetical protein
VSGREGVVRGKVRDSAFRLAQIGTISQTHVVTVGERSGPLVFQVIKRTLIIPIVHGHTFDNESPRWLHTGHWFVSMTPNDQLITSYTRLNVSFVHLPMSNAHRMSLECH